MVVLDHRSGSKNNRSKMVVLFTKKFKGWYLRKGIRRLGPPVTLHVTGLINNSWLTMQRFHAESWDCCAGNHISMLPLFEP